MQAFLPTRLPLFLFLLRTCSHKLSQCSYLDISCASEDANGKPPPQCVQNKVNKIDISTTTLSSASGNGVILSVTQADASPFASYQVTNLSVALLCYWNGFLTLPILKHRGFHLSEAGILGHGTCTDLSRIPTERGRSWGRAGAGERHLAGEAGCAKWCRSGTSAPHTQQPGRQRNAVKNRAVPPHPFIHSRTQVLADSCDSLLLISCLLLVSKTQISSHAIAI